mgnify:FL=1
MKLYQNIALRKNKIKSNKNSNQLLKKNKSLTYYHFEGQNNDMMNINDIKVNCSNNGGNKAQEYNINYLLIAYKKGVLELFKELKIYMKKEVYKYNKIKNEFIQNIQKFYNEEKTKDKKIIKKTASSMNYNNIKSYSKKKIITNGRKSNQIKEDLMKNITSNISSQTQILNKINNNGSNINNFNYINNKTHHKNINKRNKINNNYNFKSFVNHKSLYSLLKNNKLLGNSPLKYMDNCKNNNIIKKFIKFSNNISKTKNKEKKENKKINEENNKIMEKTAKNNDLLLKIKDSLDDNLKHILNFSYENFLNKESERECN